MKSIIPFFLLLLLSTSCLVFKFYETEPAERTAAAFAEPVAASVAQPADISMIHTGEVAPLPPGHQTPMVFFGDDHVLSASHFNLDSLKLPLGDSILLAKSVSAYHPKKWRKKHQFSNVIVLLDEKMIPTDSIHLINPVRIGKIEVKRASEGQGGEVRIYLKN